MKDSKIALNAVSKGIKLKTRQVKTAVKSKQGNTTGTESKRNRNDSNMMDSILEAHTLQLKQTKFT